jgi:S-adenosyl methyltransferase
VSDDQQEDLMARVDTSVPVSARIWNYWMGGNDYYPIDKQAGDAYAQMSPGVFDLARSCRSYLVRAVRYAAGELGVRQFLDIGSGLPSNDPTHEVAQRVAPETHVVCGPRPARSHARALLTSNPRGGTDYIEADLYKPEALIGIARTKLDFGQPVAIMLMGVMGHIGNPDENDDEVARSIVDRLKDALPSGGYFVMYEGINTDPAQNEALMQYNASGAIPYHVRRPEQVLRFFEGLQVVDPGVVPIHEWRPDPGTVNPPEVPALGGVGKKP